MRAGEVRADGEMCPYIANHGIVQRENWFSWKPSVHTSAPHAVPAATAAGSSPRWGSVALARASASHELSSTYN